jgi:ribosomal protein S18 acetylase RimI-like enzyme
MRYAALMPGPASPLPEVPGLAAARLRPADEAELQAFYEVCRDYVELVTGAPPGPGEARALLSELPPGKDLADKYVFGFRDASGKLVGVLDLVRDYPRPREWYLSLLLFGPASRGRRHGEGVYRWVAGWVAAEGGRAVRLVVTEDNPKAIRFWQRMGFQVEGAGTQVRGSKESVFLRMSHALAPAPGLLRRLAAAFRRAP